MIGDIKTRASVGSYSFTHHPSQMFQIGVYHRTENVHVITIGCFEKFASVNPINGKAVTNLNEPLFDILFWVSLTEMLVLLNEPVSKSSIIRSKFDTQVYEIPTGRSGINDQIDQVLPKKQKCNIISVPSN